MNLEDYVLENEIDIPYYYFTDTDNYDNSDILTYAIENLSEDICINILKYIDRLECIQCIDDHNFKRDILLVQGSIPSIDIPDDELYKLLLGDKHEEYCHRTNLTLPMLAIKRGFPKVAYQMLTKFPNKQLLNYMNYRNTYHMALECGYTDICKLFNDKQIRLFNCNKYSNDTYEMVKYLFCYHCVDVEMENFSQKMERFYQEVLKLKAIPETLELYSDQFYLLYQDEETRINFLVDYHMKFSSEFLDNFIDISNETTKINYIPKLLLELLPIKLDNYLSFYNIFLGSEKVDQLFKQYYLDRYVYEHD
jgi:hypothetical protein